MKLVNVKQIEENLCLGHTKVAEIIRTGELQTIKIGRSRRSSPEWLAEFIQLQVDRQSSDEGASDDSE